MRSIKLRTIMCLVALQGCAFLTASAFENNLGRVVRGQLGTLYDLRSKLSGSGATHPTTTERPVADLPTPAHSATRRTSGYGQSAVKTEVPAVLRKDSRGYAFHYSPAEVTNPIYADASSVKVKPSTGRWRKKGERNWEKYVKKSTQSASNTGNDVAKDAPAPSTTPKKDISAKVKTTSSPNLDPSPTTPMPSFLPFGGDALKTLSQGLNSAMTAVITQKLVNMIDHDVPPSLLDPMRHVVASGNRMVEFWDKRTIARDGKTPAMMELLGYGLDQLKKFKDGQPLNPSDPVSENTSPSKTLIQGLVTVKKLTNRVLGYDTDMEPLESRGGYGHDSYGGGYGGHHVSYGHYLDPYAILATLGFGVFLFNVIFNLLNNQNTASGRSLDVSDLDVPLALSDIVSGSDASEKIFGTPTIRAKRGADYDEGNAFYSIIDKLDGIFKSYNQVTEKPRCIRLYMCRLAVQEATGDINSVLSKLYMFGLQQYSRDSKTKQFISSIQDKVAAGENVNCDEVVKNCSPLELYDDDN